MRRVSFQVAIAFVHCVLAGGVLPSAGSAWAGRVPVEMPFLKTPGAADRLISLDLNQVDIRIFIKTVGQLTGINFLIDDKIQGNVTLLSPTKIPLCEVYGVFESVLQTKGFAAVPVGTLVKVVPRADGVKSNLPIRIGCDPAAIPIDDSLVTQIIPLQHVDVAQVSTIVSSLLSAGGQATPFPETGTLIITDTSSSIHRVATIVAGLDIEGPQDGVEIVHLKYASASKTCEQVMQIMQRNVSVGKGRRLSTSTPDASGTVKILADDRTNSVVIMASPAEVEVVRRIVAKLDVERPQEAGNIHVIFLEHAEAKEIEKAVSASLGKITGGAASDRQETFQITSDESTNALIVVASAQDYELVEGMVKQLDIVREQILVEFQIVEASNEVLKELGFDWTTMDAAVSDSVRGFGYTNLGPRVEAASGDLDGLGIGMWKQVNDETQIGAILKALETDSAVNILSTPHVLTSNHQEAMITVGENVPYVSQSRVTETDVQTPTAIKTYDFKDVGVELKVRPHVSAGNFIRMEIEASFSKLIAGTTGLGSETPTTAQRKAKTIISIPDATTVVIGGLMRDDKELVETKVPLLGDLPLVGSLFRSTKEVVQKTNLLLFITPHVLANRDGLEDMTERKKQQQSSAEGSGREP